MEATLVPAMKVYKQCWKELADWCAQQDVPSNAVSVPKFAIFQILPFCACCAIDIYHSVIVVFSSVIIFIRYLIILSSLC